MRSPRLLPLSVALLLAAGCNVGRNEVGTLAPVENPHPELTPLPDPDAQGGNVGRAPRRLTVAQLDRSIQITTGRTWTGLATLGASLGQADFALTNTESIDANLVFAKFLEVGARTVCDQASAGDQAQATASLRVLSPEVAAKDPTLATDAEISRNLDYLALRFWGDAFAAEEKLAYTELFKKAGARAKTLGSGQYKQAWGVVCVALLTDPRFFTY
jgi:hypothetical protein